MTTLARPLWPNVAGDRGTIGGHRPPTTTGALGDTPGRHYGPASEPKPPPGATLVHEDTHGPVGSRDVGSADALDTGVSELCHAGYDVTFSRAGDMSCITIHCTRCGRHLDNQDCRMHFGSVAAAAAAAVAVHWLVSPHRVWCPRCAAIVEPVNPVRRTTTHNGALTVAGDERLTITGCDPVPAGRIRQIRGAGYSLVGAPPPSNDTNAAQPRTEHVSELPEYRRPDGTQPISKGREWSMALGTSPHAVVPGARAHHPGSGWYGGGRGSCTGVTRWPP